MPLALFALFLVWPFAHMALVEIKDFSRWRLFGWGMYSEPHPYDNSYVKILVDSPAEAGDNCSWYGGELREDQRLTLSFLARSYGKGSGREAVAQPFSAFEELITFRSKRAVNRVWNSAVTVTGRENASGLVVLGRQRYDIDTRQLYFDGTVYRCDAICQPAFNATGDALAVQVAGILEGWEHRCGLRQS